MRSAARPIREVLTARRRATLRQLALELCPPVDDVGMLDGIVDQVAVTAMSLSRLVRRTLLIAIDLESVRGVGRGRTRSSAANAADGMQRGSALGVGRLRRSLRDVLVVAYYDQADVKARLGYDPDSWTAAMAGAREAQWSAAIDAHRSLLRSPRPRPPIA